MSRDAFKFGFLLRCADEGLSPAETLERVKQAGLVKQAIGPAAGLAAGLGIPAWLLPMLGKGLGAGVSTVSGLGGLGLGAAALTGVAAGYGGAKMLEDDIDPEEIKKQELIAAYRQQAEQARRTASRIGYRTKHLQSRAPRAPSF